MSWIKENKFIVALGGGTLIGVAVLLFVGLGGAKRYEESQQKFEEAKQEVSGYERLPLYPKTEHRDSKSKALDDYRKSIETLQAAYDKFHPKEIKNISPQEFTERLKAADVELRKAFEDAGTTVPDAFFVGFEQYRTSLANANTTGILDYQLSAIKEILMGLAKAAPSELRNLHRPTLPEENGQSYSPQPNDVARALPLEITFVGPEGTGRKFLSSILNPENHYVVVRSFRVSNEKKDPPKAADAKFEKPAEAKPPGGAADVFGGGFVLPGDDAVPEATADAPADAPVDAPVEEAVADSGKILAQVLGNEEIQIFVRLDILQFLPAKKLP